MEADQLKPYGMNKTREEIYDSQLILTRTITVKCPCYFVTFLSFCDGSYRAVVLVASVRHFFPRDPAPPARSQLRVLCRAARRVAVRGTAANK